MIRNGCSPLPSYIERIKRLSLQTLELRRFYADLCMVYCIVHNVIDLPFREFFEYSNTIGWTRSSHRFKLTVNKCHFNSFKYSFSNRVIEAWNSCPQNIAEASSLKTFKARLQAIPPEAIAFHSRIRT